MPDNPFPNYMSFAPGLLHSFRARLSAVCAAVGRDPGGVRLVAVSKTFPASDIRAAADAGCGDFGENYLQEARAKMAELGDLPLEWHFVGAAQSNKAAAIARRFGWAHGIDRADIAEKMSAARPADFPPLNVFLQVNINREPTKSGVLPEDAAAVARAMAGLPRLRLRGLTAIPAPDAATRRDAFRATAKLRDAIVSECGVALPDLSMGMSADWEEAVAEGATVIRVGEAIFGKREKKETAQ